MFDSESRTFGFFAVACVAAADIHGVGKTAAVAVITAVFSLTGDRKMRTSDICKSFGCRLFGKIFTAGRVRFLSAAAAYRDTFYGTTAVFVMGAVSRLTGKIGHIFSPFAPLLRKQVYYLKKSRRYSCLKKNNPIFL